MALLPNSKPLCPSQDHTPLLWMHRLKDSNDKILRWYLALLLFSFMTQHCRGPLHTNVDYLSWVSNVDNPQAPSSRGGPVGHSHECPIYLFSPAGWRRGGQRCRELRTGQEWGRWTQAKAVLAGSPARRPGLPAPQPEAPVCLQMRCKQLLVWETRLHAQPRSSHDGAWPALHCLPSSCLVMRHRRQLLRGPPVRAQPRGSCRRGLTASGRVGGRADQEEQIDLLRQGHHPVGSPRQQAQRPRSGQ